MLRVENVEVFNFKGALRGMRNPKASWAKADSVFDEGGRLVSLGENDTKLAKLLVSSGTDHGKFIRQIFVCMDIIAPDYWWKEMDTYKVGTVANSTSTMHKLTAKPLTAEDFSWDNDNVSDFTEYRQNSLDHLNFLIDKYIKWKEKEPSVAKSYWRELIQDLPMSFNYTRTWTADYQNLRNMYFARKNHKLSEWHTLCDVIESLPAADVLITSNSWWQDKIEELEHQIKDGQ